MIADKKDLSSKQAKLTALLHSRIKLNKMGREGREALKKAIKQSCVECFEDVVDYCLDELDDEDCEVTAYECMDAISARLCDSQFAENWTPSEVEVSVDMVRDYADPEVRVAALALDADVKQAIAK